MWIPNSALEEYARHLSDAQFHLLNAHKSLDKAKGAAPDGKSYHDIAKAMKAVKSIRVWAKNHAHSAKRAAKRGKSG